MVTVYFGRDPLADIDPDRFFKRHWKLEWFEDEFVKRMVEEIDNSKVLSIDCIQSPVFRQIPPERLSGGLKGCIMLYKIPDKYYPNLIVFGENCQQVLSEIFQKVDCQVCDSGNHLVFEDLPIQGVCRNDGSTFNNWVEWTNIMTSIEDDVIPVDEEEDEEEGSSGRKV